MGRFGSLEEASRLSGRSVNALRAMIRRGELGDGVVYRIGRRRIAIDLGALTEWMRSRPLQAGGASPEGPERE